MDEATLQRVRGLPMTSGQCLSFTVSEVESSIADAATIFSKQRGQDGAIIRAYAKYLKACQELLQAASTGASAARVATPPPVVRPLQPYAQLGQPSSAQQLVPVLPVPPPAPPAPPSPSPMDALLLNWVLLQWMRLASELGMCAEVAAAWGKLLVLFFKLVLLTLIFGILRKPRIGFKLLYRASSHLGTRSLG